MEDIVAPWPTAQAGRAQPTTDMCNCSTQQTVSKAWHGRLEDMYFLLDPTMVSPCIPTDLDKLVGQVAVITEPIKKKDN